jgi:hypothetical protein
MKTTTTPTISEFKAWSLSHYSLAHAVCAAKAYAQCRREQVDAYLRPIFDSFKFTIGEEFGGRRGDAGKPITDPTRLYLCGDEELCKDYFHACDLEHRKHGFTGPYGHCPALIAEHLLVIAENALLDAGCKLMGIEDGHAALWGDKREKMLDLLLGACLNAKKEAA